MKTNLEPGLHREQILILAKTYPIPSAQYMETSCIAGINEHGVMRRLYPVSFRILEKEQQFRKWQWIDVSVKKAVGDNRPESFKVDVGSMNICHSIDTTNKWAARREWINKIPTFNSFEDIKINQSNKKETLALLKPKRLIDLEILKSSSQDWTEEEKIKLMKDQIQGDLFSEDEAKKQVKTLRKVPYDFYYRYACDTPAGEIEDRHKINDWEAGSLYWNCQRRYGSNWEKFFKEKLLEEFSQKDLMLLMGNIHRFPDQWLIISLIYPPKSTQISDIQPSLF